MFCIVRVFVFSLLFSGWCCASANPARQLVKIVSSKPLLSNMVIASGLSIAGDGLSQCIEISRDKWAGVKPESRNKEFSPLQRSLAIAVFGAIVNGGFLTWWFGLLNKAIPAKDIKTVILKVGVNQAVLSPTLNTLMFLYIILTKDKRSLSQKWNDFQRKLAADLFPTIKRSLYFWGTIQCINFSFVPVGEFFKSAYIQNMKCTNQGYHKFSLKPYSHKLQCMYARFHPDSYKHCFCILDCLRHSCGLQTCDFRR